MYLHFFNAERLMRTLANSKDLGIEISEHPHLASVSMKDLASLGLVGHSPILFGADAGPETVVNDWLCSLCQPAGGTAGTRRTYAYAMRQFLEFCASLPVSLAAVRFETVLRYWRCRRLVPGDEQIKAKTWNVHAAAICSFFEFAAHQGVPTNFQLPDISDKTLNHFNRDTKNPLKEKTGASAPKWITINDYVHKVRPAALTSRFGFRNAAFLDLLVSTGFRLNEGASQHALEWPTLKDHPSSRKVIPFQLWRGCKGGRPREVLTPLHCRVVQSIEAFIQGDRAELCHRAGMRDAEYAEPAEIWVGADGRVNRPGFRRGSLV